MAMKMVQSVGNDVLAYLAHERMKSGPDRCTCGFHSDVTEEHKVECAWRKAVERSWEHAARLQATRERGPLKEEDDHGLPKFGFQLPPGVSREDFAAFIASKTQRPQLQVLETTGTTIPDPDDKKGPGPKGGK